METKIVFRPKKNSAARASFLRTTKLAVSTLKESCTLLWDIFWENASVALADKHINQFARSLLEDSRTTLKVSGLENFKNNQSYVFMSNHKSLLDIPALFVSIPQSLRMVTKGELFNFPIFGYALIQSGFIRIDRKNHIKAVKQLEIAKQRLRDGVSVWISPEGTRSRNQAIGRFKKGGFHIAMDLDVPIVPIWIEGTSKILKPDSLITHPNKTVTVYFGKPVETSQYKKEQINSLMELIRQEITKLDPNQKV